jgi:pyridoxal phosphate enzyme (YggS family)
VALVAVSKYATADQVIELARAGQQVFGENRLHEAIAKIEASAEVVANLEWHMVGHLQTNKVPHALRYFTTIQSVDSRRLAEAISRRAAYHDGAVPILLQVNVAGDPGKHGFTVDGVRRDYEALTGLPGIEVGGLMTIGPEPTRPEDSRPTFVALRECRDALDAQGVAPPLRDLSMGMSADFEVAIEEAATIVRVGRGLFDER